VKVILDLTTCLHRCWQERTPYDEIRYLKSLQKAAPPYSNTLPTQHPNCLNNFT